MSEYPGIEIPAIPPGGQPPQVQVRAIMADADTGQAVDLNTGEQYLMTDDGLARVCAYLPDQECHCDSAAQCPLLRQQPARAAANMPARRAAYVDNGEAGINLPPGQQTYDGPPPPARPLTPNGRPQLIHSGSYGLYLTPEGSYHLVYQRTAGTNPDTGQVLAIDGAPQIHMRDLPERAANMVMAIMDRDTPLPPMIQGLIFGDAKPNLRAILAAVKSSDMGDLMNLAGGSDD